MAKIAVIIPTYNRAENLLLTLTGLAEQTIKPDEVVISDDGGSDNTLEVLKGFQGIFPIKYYWHEDKGYRVSLTRNQGTRIASKDITHFLYIDSDVVLNPKAIEAYHDIISRHPEVVVCGRYDWLPPMHITPDDIINRFEEFSQGKLEPFGKKKDPKFISHVGKDPRMEKSKAWFINEKTRNSYGVISGNLLIPRPAFNLTGGFDENIEDRGQDGEFGRNLVGNNVKGIYSQRVLGWHVSHEKDPYWETESVIRTIKYIGEKYNLKLTDENFPKMPK